MRARTLLISFFASTLGCSSHGTEDTATEGEALASASRGPLRVQAGDRLVLLGVTDDGFALYWDSGSVYATGLWPGAQREKVTEAAQPPSTLAYGKVALVWTAQDPNAAPAPSPLVVWTKAGGAKQASSASWPRALFSIRASTAVSPSSREILFVTNVAADGATGDIVRATPDLSRTTTLAHGVQVDPSGACPPHVGFDLGPSHVRRYHDDDGRGCAHEARAIVLACGASDTDATLSRWKGDRKEVLATDAMAGFWWDTDADGAHVYTRLADRSSVVFDRRGASTVIEPLSSFGWLSDDGALFLKVRTGATTAELRRYALDPAPRATKLRDMTIPESFHFPKMLPGGFPFYDLSTSPTSPDGSFFLGYTDVSPAGFANIELVDVSGPTANAVTLEQDTNDYVFAELATRDSSHALYYKLDDAFNTTLFAATRDGQKRQISHGITATETFAMNGAVIAYSDDLVGDGSSPWDTHDIEVADLGAAALSPTVVARGAYINFFPVFHRRALVFTSTTGLYLART
jgi:hypothetical protein